MYSIKKIDKPIDASRRTFFLQISVVTAGITLCPTLSFAKLNEEEVKKFKAKLMLSRELPRPPSSYEYMATANLRTSISDSGPQLKPAGPANRYSYDPFVGQTPYQKAELEVAGILYGPLFNAIINIPVCTIKVFNIPVIKRTSLGGVVKDQAKEWLPSFDSIYNFFFSDKTDGAGSDGVEQEKDSEKERSQIDKTNETKQTTQEHKDDLSHMEGDGHHGRREREFMRRGYTYNQSERDRDITSRTA